MYPSIKWREAQPLQCTKQEWAMSLLQHSTSPADSNETGWLSEKGYGRHSAGAGLTLELSPNSVAQSNNEKGKSRGDSSNKEMGKDTEYLAPQSSASPLICSPKPVPSSLHTWAWWQGSCSSAAVGMYSMPAWYIHSLCAWVIFITQGHCSFTYP